MWFLFTFSKKLKDRHFVVGGSKTFKFSTNTCFGVSFQKNVFSSLLLFLSVCLEKKKKDFVKIIHIFFLKIYIFFQRSFATFEQPQTTASEAVVCRCSLKQVLLKNFAIFRESKTVSNTSVSCKKQPRYANILIDLSLKMLGQ